MPGFLGRTRKKGGLVSLEKKGLFGHEIVEIQRREMDGKKGVSGNDEREMGLK